MHSIFCKVKKWTDRETSHTLKIKKFTCVGEWMMVWLTTIWIDSLSPLFYPHFLVKATPSLFSLSFFWVMLLGMPLFFFGIDHDYTYLRDISFGRENTNTRSVYLVADGSANSQCRFFASGNGYLHDLEWESMRIFSLGSQNLTKLNKIASSICEGFFNHLWHLTLVGIHHR